MKRAYALFFCLLTVLSLRQADATIVVIPTDEQLVAKSPVIVRGTVIQSFPIEFQGGIWTESHVSVDRVVKGTSIEPIVVIREVGGRIDDRLNVVFGSPEYKAGEKVLLFLWPTSRGDYQTRDLFVGKFTQRFTNDGKRLWHRREDHAGTHLLDGDLQPKGPNPLQREAELFESFVSERAQGRAALNNYQIEAAPLAAETTTRSSTSGSIQANFTLLSEPQIYRWFVFDSGAGAPWRSVGNQPGYADGGVSELKTGMNSWSGYAEAKIRYTYAGGSSAPAGGLGSPNGINEVIFNDPLNEIDGAYNRSTGGVIGRGGFNNGTNGAAWTSGFEADPSHPKKTYASTFNITEGNLVIQNGVSPTNGISSFVFAELIAHEFGHTLGFGHSTDAAALMYPTITGAGPALRPDDQSAARWLYPNGGGGTTPTPPASPSNLTATAASSTQLQLSWRDNATNETSHSVYLAIGNGAFTKVQDLGANLTSATLNGLVAGQTYRVNVTARNNAGESGISNTAQVTMPGTPVQAAFAVTPGSGTAGLTTFSFIDQSTGPVVWWQWNFGDGNSSTAPNPTHLFARTGTYNVMLTVGSNAGPQSNTSRNVVVVAGSPTLSANFTYSPVSPTTNDTISFLDASGGSPSSWSWTFGDGSSSSLPNPSKRYVSPGNYSVILTVTSGSSTAQTSKTVSVGAFNPVTPPVVADFVVSPATAKVKQPIAFSDRSAGSPTSWSWSFGNGATSTAQSPSYAFPAPGTYEVTLTARNSSSSSSRTRYVVVAPTSQAFKSLIPVSADTLGGAGTDWQTELSLYNAGNLAANLSFTYIPGAGGTSITRRTVLSSGSVAIYPNALRDLFGLTVGAGAIEIEATDSYGTPDIKVSSRTFTSSVGAFASSGGTYGQFVPDVIGEEISSVLYVTGLESTPSFRTNIGLVNRQPHNVSVTLTLFDPSGSVLATRTLTAPGKNFQQQPLTSMFTNLTGQRLNMSMKIESSLGDAISAYASVVDNRSQDPVYIPAVPADDREALVIPAIGRAAGGNGTFWRSDVTIYNPNSTSLSLTLQYLAAGADNRTPQTGIISLAGGGTTAIEDVLLMFGIGSGSGALQISWSGGSQQPIVTSRTYTTRASDGGSYGQSIDAISLSHFQADAFITGLKADGSYRSNLGFVNSSNQTIGVTVTAYGTSGQVMATTFLSLKPKSQEQYTLANLFVGKNLSSLGHFTLRAQSDSPSLYVYGSVIDNVTGDPVFMGGE